MRWFYLAMALFLLVGCGDQNMVDLNHYIQTTKAKPKEKIQPLPEKKDVQAFVFNPNGLRDPFREIEQPKVVEDKPENTQNEILNKKIAMHQARKKEELEQFSTDSLKMVGTVKIQNELWALLKTAEGKIYRVKNGYHIGQNYGEITHVAPDKIELIEILTDKSTPREETKTLSLLSSSKE